MRKYDWYLWLRTRTETEILYFYLFFTQSGNDNIGAWHVKPHENSIAGVIINFEI